MKSRTLVTVLILCLLWAVSCTSKDKYQSITDEDIAKIESYADFDMAKLKAPKFPSNTMLITDNGAVPDGITLCSEAIQNTIDQICAKGGGTVIIPAGIWLSGPIVLKDNVRLYLSNGALLQFSTDFSLYPIYDTSFEGVDTRRCQSPISAIGAKNNAITGEGIINGGGDAWRPLKKNKVAPSVWKEKIKNAVVFP